LITDLPISVKDHIAALPGDGAVVVFTGIVRADEKDGRRVTHIHYECYETMAQRELEALEEEVRAATGVTGIRVLHRVGDVPAGEVALLVVVTAGHRGEAYEASRTVVEEVKHRVPIWKKEVYDDGTAEWL
jgi:molybdopterin synthase catalytic subunit